MFLSPLSRNSNLQVDFLEKDVLCFAYLLSVCRALQDEHFECKNIRWGATDLELHGSEKGYFPTLKKRKKKF